MSEGGREKRFDPAEFEKNHPPLQNVPDESTGVFEISPELLKAAKEGANIEKNHPSLADAPEEHTGVIELDEKMQKLIYSTKAAAPVAAETEEAAPETVRPPEKLQAKTAMVAKDVGSEFTSAVADGKEVSTADLIRRVTATLKSPEFANEKFSSVEVLLDLKEELKDTAKWLRAAGKESAAKKHEEMAKEIAAAADAAGDKRPIEVDVDEIY